MAIVERYDGVRHTCARYLEHFHFNVMEAASTAKGLVLLQTARPAVILIEDDASGHFEELRREATALAIPIVSMTTALSDAAVGRPATASAVRVLQKPFSLLSMLEEIRRALRSVDTTQQVHA